MPRIWPVLLLLSLLAPCAAAQTHAQPVSSSPLKATRSASLRAALNGPQSGTQTVTLGNATVPLTGPWKFHTGDNMAWAQPDFDDSNWGTMDLTPPPGSYDPLIGSSGYVPGWTSRGYKGYHGYAWYRLQVNIQSSQRALALKMPDNFDDAYQVYVNGKLIGEFGRFTAQGVSAYVSIPRAFPLPASVSTGPATVAIRMWMEAFTPLVDQDAGGLHGPPVLGQASAIAALLQLDWGAVNRSLFNDFLEIAILLVALLVAFGLFWLDRREHAYLWLGITCAIILARVAIVVAVNYTPFLGTINFLIEDAILTPAFIGLWVVFWAYWFRLDGMARVHRATWGLVVLLGLGTAMLRSPFYGGIVPAHAIVWLSPLTVALKLLLGVLLVWVAYRGIRKDRTEGWLALPAVVLVIVSQYQEELLVLHVPSSYFPFGVAVTLSAMATVLSLVIVTVLLVRRFVHGQREREQWKLEIEQAKQIQQVLIPEALPVVPGFTIESEYRPAQQVGGDFFQIVQEKDGSVLIVLGDVTGHGLKAAMMVSLLVGAVRNQAEASFDPMAMLENLNRRLLGRGRIYATCLALHIQPDGAVSLANAGHLPPFLNGKELEIEGSLPLGISPDTQFTQTEFRLVEHDWLLLLTDGVAEARDKEGKLFGFDRVATLVRNPIAAADVASAAQAYGQQDDITVLRILREAKAAPHTGTEPAIAV